MNLGELFQRVREDYRGTKDELRSVARLKASISRLGPPSTPVTSITTLALDKLVSEMRAEGFDPKTINRYLAAISKALQWAVDREVIQRKPKIPLLPEGSGRITFLSESQATSLCLWLDSHNYHSVSVVSQVLLATGFRITELLSRSPRHLESAEVTSADEEPGYWLVLETGDTKNNQPRAAWLSEPLGASLAREMDLGLPSYREILQGLSAASVGLKLGFKVTPHVLRHTTATRLTANGVPTAVVKDYMGHRSIQTTLRYTHVQRADIRHAAGTLQVVNGHTVVNPSRICSPLRSHSATRPRQ